MVNTSLRKMLTSLVALLRRLAGSGWGAGTTTLRTATLAPCPLNSRVLGSCLVPQCSHPPRCSCHQLRRANCDWMPASYSSPADNIPILAGIHPSERRCSGATQTLTCRAVEPGHLRHSTLTRSTGGNARLLKSRHPFVLAAQQLISSADDNNRNVAIWADY